jgi:hypothetical protein
MISHIDLTNSLEFRTFVRDSFFKTQQRVLIFFIEETGYSYLNVLDAGKKISSGLRNFILSYTFKPEEGTNTIFTENVNIKTQDNSEAQNIFIQKIQIVCYNITNQDYREECFTPFSIKNSISRN